MKALDVSTIGDRENIGDWLNRNGLTGTVAEIGCYNGTFAKIVLSRWHGTKYLMVDLWAKQPAEVYREDFSKVDFEGCLKDCVHLSQSDHRVKLLRGDSALMAETVPDNSLDWVFIDANHAYGPVIADMNAWYPKVKPGGIFSGHDYYDERNWPHFCEVKTAVDEWMKKHALPFHINLNGDHGGWWSQKPIV